MHIVDALMQIWILMLLINSWTHAVAKTQQICLDKFKGSL